MYTSVRMDIYYVMVIKVDLGNETLERANEPRLEYCETPAFSIEIADAELVL